MENKGNEKIDNKFEDMMKELTLSIKQSIPSVEMIEKIAKPLVEIVVKMTEAIKPVVDLVIDMQVKYAPFFKELGEALDKAKKNPDSAINWFNYSEKLSEYIWTVPYQMDSRQLKYIFEKVDSESNFDSYMGRYYTKARIERLFSEIKIMLPNVHKTLFNQIELSFYDKRYSLSIIGIMSIIDELCSYFLFDKGVSARQNLFKPIIEDIDSKDGITLYLLNIMILSNNINTIYENIDFNNKIEIKTNKKARRNPCQHGRSYSNRKIDAIMLLNTIYNLLIAQKVGLKYKDKLKYKSNKKEFCIETE